MGSDYRYADLEIGLKPDLQKPQTANTYPCQIDLRFRLPDSDGETDLMDGTPGAASFSLGTFLALGVDPVAYGQQLGKALFTDPHLVTGFAKAQFSAAQQGVHLRVRLAIPPALMALHALHWEKLILPTELLPLSYSERVLFSRYLTSSDPRPIPRPKPRDVKALIVVARPTNLAALGLEITVADELLEASAALQSAQATQLTDTQATLDAIRQEIRNGHDVIYLVAHGQINAGKPWLCLPGPTGEATWIDGATLAAQIGQLERLPKLIVLASCVSAGSGKQDASVLAALGPLLVRAGVPAVIAMQSNIKQQTAAQFMPVLFAELNRTGLIDQAVAIARNKVRSELDWWAPVLFMRLDSGLLFDTTQLVPIAKPPDVEIVRQLLGKLNYAEQTTLFRRYCRKQRSAFLISGQDQKAGQRWLLCRLLHSLPVWQQRRVLIKLDFGGLRGVTLHAEFVWEKVAEQLGVDPGLAPAAIIDSLAQRWQQHHLILVFLNVTDYLEIIVHEVWQKLTERLGETTAHKNQLFLFVTNDDEPLPPITQVITAEQPPATANGHVAVPAVRLPELPTHFRQDEIDEWIFEQQEALAALVQNQTLRENPAALLDEIWAEDEGIPMPTMKTIYGLCVPPAGGQRWTVIKKQWTEVY